jgi:hypothetical protein
VKRGVRVAGRCAALAVSLAALAACTNHDYYGTANVSGQEGDPRAQLDVNVGIWMAQGSAASAHIDLVGVGGTSYQGDVRSEDPTVLSIFHTPGDPGRYVFLGTYAGNGPNHTVVDIYVNGVAVRSTVATVETPSDDNFAPDAGESLADGGAEASADAGQDAQTEDAASEPQDGEADAGDGA